MTSFARLRPRHLRLRTSALAASLALLAAAPAGAVTVVWGGGTGSWTSSANWIGGLHPNSQTDWVYIDGGNAANSAVTLTGTVALGRLYIDAGDSLALNPGATLNLYGGQINNNGLLSLGGDNSSGGSSLTLGANATLAGTGTTLLTAANSSYAGQINAGSHVLTIASGHTVSGAGQITGSVVNQGTVVANGATPLTLAPTGGKTFDNSAGLVQVTDGSTLALTAGTLSGGTVRSLGDGRLTGTGSNSTFKDLTLAGKFTFSNVGTFNGVTIAGNVSVVPGATLYIAGTLTNNGTLTLGGDNLSGSSQLYLSANTTLGGTGTTQLSAYNSSYHGQVNAGSYALTVANGHTVRGAGSITGTVVNHGTVIADGSIALTLKPTSGKTFDNGTGLIQVTDGSTLALSTGTLSGGTVQSLGTGRLAGTGSTSTFKDLTLAGNFAFINVGTFNGVTIAGNVSVTPGAAVYTSGALTNNGTLSLGGDNLGGGSQLYLNANTTLGGTGTTLLSAYNSSYHGQINAGSYALTIASGHTVSGAGTITGAVTNQGTVVANGAIPLTLSPTSGKTFDNSAGLIQVTDGSTLALTTGTLSGGTVQGLGSGRVTGTGSTSTFKDVTLAGNVTFGGAGTFNGVTIADSLTIAPGTTVYTSGALTNNGTFSLGGDNLSGGTQLYLNANTTLGGTGTTVLSVYNSSYFGQINAGAYALTIASGHTVRGAGQINGSVTNLGTVVADGTLTLNPGSSTRSFDNSAGLIRVTDGSTLVLGTGTLSGGTVQSLGQARLSSANSSSVLSGATLLGSFSVAPGSSLYASGTLTNNGTLTLAGNNSNGGSALQLAANTTLGGTGTTQLAAFSSSYYGEINAGAHTLTIGNGHTVRGAGQINGSVTNLGTVVADGTLTLNPGSSARSFDNSAGLIRVTDGSTLVLGTGTLSGGTLQSLGQARLSSATSSSILSGATLLGSFSVAPGSSLYASGTLTNNGLLTLGGNNTNGGSTLYLATSTTLAGTGTTQLAAYNSSYYGHINAGSHTLTIANGHTVSGAGQINGSSLINHGTVAPGDGVGRLAVSGGLTLAGDALLRIDVAGLTQTTRYDLLAVTGNVNLGGTVLFDLGSFEGQVGNSFTFLTFTGSSTGTFDAVQAAGYEVSLSYGAQSVTATITGITAVPEPGTWALLLGGLAVVTGLVRRRRAMA